MSSLTSKLDAGLSLASRIITGWALVGGMVLMAVVLMNTYSVIGANFNSPFPGDFEMTEMGICLAVFCFLPYCQLTGANVTADIFTSGLSERWIAVLTLVASIIALGFSLLLLWRMYAGMLDQKEYDYMTAILQVPHWWAYLPVLISLALLALAAIITLRNSFKSI